MRLAEQYRHILERLAARAPFGNPLAGIRRVSHVAWSFPPTGTAVPTEAHARSVVAPTAGAGVI